MANDIPSQDEAAAEHAPSLLGAVWDTLRSPRSTVWILALIAVGAALGAVIPQDRHPDYYRMVYGARWGGVVTALGLDGLYGSTWFVLLLALLLANLAACTGRSWRRAVARYRGPSAETLARKLEGPQSRACYQAGLPTGDAQVAVTGALRRAHYAVAVSDASDGSRLILARRWAFTAFGGILTHLAVFLVALGATLGWLPWTSLDERLTLAEGESRAESDRGLPLPLDVRLDDFRMEYYPETGTPSAYESDLVFSAGGSELSRGMATVNKPVSVGGISFGQSSWGLAGVRVVVKPPSASAEEAFFPLMETVGTHGESAWAVDDRGRVAFVANRALALVAEHFVADAAERDGEIVGSASHYPRNPALLLSAVSELGSGEHGFHTLGWLRPDGELTYEGYTIRFGDVAYTSTLSVRKDPGLLLVWGGFILISLGMIVTFYVRPSGFLVELPPAGTDGPRLARIAPAGPELEPADLRVLQEACGGPLSPLPPPEPQSGRRRRR